MTTNKKFLILGGGGQLGCEWVRSLRERDLDYLSTSYPALDISDNKALKKQIQEFKPDYVINCAAYTQVDKAEDEPEKAEEINHHAVKNLAEFCRDSDSTLVHYSTDYVFSGDEADRKTWPEGYSENAPINPVNAYGMSKWKGEDAVRNITQNHLICRISWLCGPDGHNFVKTMLRLAGEQKPLKVVDDQLGSPTFTRDVVDANLRLLEQQERGTFHVTSSGIMSWYDFAVMTFKLAGIQADITPVTSAEFPTKAVRPKYSKLSTEKYETISGGITYDPEVSLKKLLELL